MSGRPQCLRAEQAVGWAMHALEPGDEDALTKHLPYCHPCREAVSQTEELMRVLASVATQVEPRAELRDELLASVAATPQTPRDRRLREPPDFGWPMPSEPGASSPASAREDWAPAPPELGSLVGDRVEARRWATRRRGTIVLAASMAAAMIVIGIGGMVTRQVADTQQRQAVQARQLQHVVAQASAVGVRYALLSTPGGPPVAAVLLDGGQRRVVPSGLPANEPDRSTYVLWGLGGARPVPLGTFDVTSTDRGPRTVGWMSRDDSFTGYAVSIERGRKAPAMPSVMMVASGQVTR